MAESKEELKSLLMRVKEESEKAGLKLNIKKLRSGWILEKGIPKIIYFCFIDYVKAFDCVTTNCGKFLKRWEYQTTLPAS